MLTGIHILLTGWTMIILGTGARRVTDRIEETVDDAVDMAEDTFRGDRS